MFQYTLNTFYKNGISKIKFKDVLGIELRVRVEKLKILLIVFY